ncbi:MAG TPA: hypothetical protein VEU33_28285, partial [Archangium sp.]|nr:hypothetical protein [Archangium sp.]
CPAYCSSMGIQVGPVAGGGVFAHSYFSCNMPIAVGYARTYAKSDQTPAQELAHGGFSVANYGVYYAAPGTSGCVSSATFSINCPSFVYAVNRTTCF